MTDLCARVDAHREDLIALARAIWEDPELGMEERHAAARTARLLEENGFTAEVGVYGLPTALRAAWGAGRPVVGFCGEYDCLPGLSQQVCAQQAPVTPGGPGHGCGHHLLGAGCAGAAIALKEALSAAGLPGTVIYYGCPAEELTNAKGRMANAGAFTECDFTLAWHPASNSRDTVGSHTAVEEGCFTFTGQPAHAAAAPHLGRSALDAVQLMDLGAEFLREHVTPDVRIHYVIKDGGRAANVVPDHAMVEYSVRALTREAVLDAFARVENCARGAALMTDTQVEITRYGGLYPTLQNTVLAAAVQRARQQVPPETYVPEELAFADALDRTCPGYEPDRTPPMDTEDQTLQDTPIYSSTDYGDVEHLCPGFHVREACAPTLVSLHSWQMTAAGGSSLGAKGMLRAAKLMALAAWDVMTHPEVLAAAREEFRANTAGKPYVSPLPAPQHPD